MTTSARIYPNRDRGNRKFVVEEVIESPKVLVVEDESTLLEALQYTLSKQGYSVSTADNGTDAVKMALNEPPDIVILDVMLPGIDGFEVCRLLRQETNVPILMLTARTEEVDKIVGLEVGADDYLTKPFSMRELTARIKAQLRRVRLIREEVVQHEKDVAQENGHSAGAMVFNDLVINAERREVLLDNERLPMKPMEFDLLEFLARNRNLVLSRDQILEKVWGWDYNGGSRTVDVHVRWLREKIEEEPAHPQRIITVRGIGYRFEG